MFQIYYRYLQLKYKINKVLTTIITDLVSITLFICFILVLFYYSIGLFDFFNMFCLYQISLKFNI